MPRPRGALEEFRHVLTLSELDAVSSWLKISARWLAQLCAVGMVQRRTTCWHKWPEAKARSGSLSSISEGVLFVYIPVPRTPAGSRVHDILPASFGESSLCATAELLLSGGMTRARSESFCFGHILAVSLHAFALMQHLRCEFLQVARKS